MLGRSDFARHQIAGDGGKVFIGFVAVFLKRGAVPGGAVFATAADIGQHINAVATGFVGALQPGAADAARVVRRERHFKAAVAVKQGRVFAVGFKVFVGDDEIRNAGAVFAADKILLGGVVGGGEEGRGAFEFFRLPAGFGQIQGIGFGKAADVYPQSVGLFSIDGGNADFAVFRQPFDGAALPAFACRRQHYQPVFHVLQQIEYQPVFRPHRIVERSVGSRLEQHADFALTLHPVFKIGNQIGARFVGFSLKIPVFARA